MRKIVTLAVALLLAATGMAQTNSNAKFNLVVGNFSGDYADQQRVNVISELCKSHRANVIEQGVYNALPQNVRSKMQVFAVITGKSTLTTEQKESTRTDKNGNKKTVITYNSKMATTLTFTDPASGKTICEPVFESTSYDEDRSKSINNAIAVGSTKGKQMFLVQQLLSLEEFLQDKYPLHGKIINVEEAKKNKAEVVTVNLGSRDAIYRGQTFEIVGEKKNYGKLRVREINDDSLSTLSVEKSGKDIMKAIANGEELQIVSYVQVISLNGLVRVEQEAPRLTVTSIDEVKKRNVAFGGITGGAPDNFVSTVKSKLKDNRRVNGYELGAKDCPALETLDGLVYGYYTGMENTSRLVKAEEELLVLKDYTEYTCRLGWYLFIVDPKTGNIVSASNEGCTAISDESAEAATNKAIRNAADIPSATYSTYPLIGTILTIEDGDTKKAKSVSIDLGSDFPVREGLRFDVYTQDAAAGWEKVGRIEVANIVDGTHSSCTVKKGGEAIRKAVEENLPIRITTFILKELLEL